MTRGVHLSQRNTSAALESNSRKQQHHHAVQSFSPCSPHTIADITGMTFRSYTALSHAIMPTTFFFS